MNYKEYILIYALFINFLSFVLFFLDKRKAIKDKWRIKERTLHISSFLGGALGSILAMYLFHHKTRKIKFCVITAISFIFNIFIIYVYCYYIYK
ncbi:uncharacterized membrane protein YsdA (DUF1294 family) [Sedimentibacter acidaminivorans]|uniref:Uncharacterized membrane protein YsdA (DUF1294 family) n=1 Tax=Sedimentibacter acidaminivorans TaxID=913099 RepID=A0ABS4GE07_9FIRM|nr:DUF1294 domain-containing protein [Sedimentibacter acidaminivorans]MBP1925925.1 uncharacterized membrane protein YsdA (DUF1294 family) [Sedimentibacter acidaminivorans]